MAPSLITHYEVYNNINSTGTVVTPAFTPSTGEILIVKLATWSTTVSMSAPTGGGLTYNSAIIAAPGGFNPWCAIYWAQVSGSPGSMTVSSSPASSSWHSMVVERWSGATMDATPAVNSTITGIGAPSATVTTTASNSVVSTVSGDAGNVSPAGRTYLSSATEDGLQDGSSGFNGVTYYYYQSAASAGVQTVGMSAPTGQRWALAAVEIKAGTQAYTVTATATVTTTVAITRQAGITLATAVATTASLTRRLATTLTATVTATASLTRRAALRITGAVTATASLTRQAAVRLAATVTTAGSATATVLGKLVNITITYGQAFLKWSFSLARRRFQTGEARRKWNEGEADL